MIVVAGYIELDPAERKEFLAVREPSIRAVREETGCVEYSFAADATDPGIVRVFEIWETPEALDAHLAVRSMSSESRVAVHSRALLRYEIASVGPLRST